MVHTTEIGRQSGESLAIKNFSVSPISGSQNWTALLKRSYTMLCNTKTYTNAQRKSVVESHTGGEIHIKQVPEGLGSKAPSRPSVKLCFKNNHISLCFKLKRN